MKSKQKSVIQYGTIGPLHERYPYYKGADLRQLKRSVPAVYPDLAKLT